MLDSAVMTVRQERLAISVAEGLAVLQWRDPLGWKLPYSRELLPAIVHCLVTGGLRMCLDPRASYLEGVPTQKIRQAGR